MPRLLLVSILGTAILAAAFARVLFREEPTLEDSLLETDLETAVRISDVLVADAPVLPSILRSAPDAEARYLVRGTVLIPRDADVVVPSGVSLFADTDARIVVEGSLTVEGALFLSNRRHPAKRFWHGITARDGGTLTLTGATVSDATAAVTCARGGRVTVEKSRLDGNVAGIVSLPGSHCAARDSTIARGRVGLHAVGGQPEMTDVTLTRLTDGIRVLHDGRPRLARLTMSRLERSAVSYRAEPDLAISGLTITPPAPLSDLLRDGRNHPTHSWNGAEYPTGVVTVTPASPTSNRTPLSSNESRFT